MATKREILEKLKRDDLLAVLDRCELAVTDRRVRDDIVDVLARSPRVKLDELLAGFPRDTLKKVCRDLGLDESGREKEGTHRGSRPKRRGCDHRAR